MYTAADWDSFFSIVYWGYVVVEIEVRQKLYNYRLKDKGSYKYILLNTEYIM